jgi:hypothetical protein
MAWSLQGAVTDFGQKWFPFFDDTRGQFRPFRLPTFFSLPTRLIKRVRRSSGALFDGGMGLLPNAFVHVRGRPTTGTQLDGRGLSPRLSRT